MQHVVDNALDISFFRSRDVRSTCSGNLQLHMQLLVNQRSSAGCECSSIYSANTHTHTFNGLFSRTTRVSRNQKGKTSLDFTEARDSEWQWHQLDHMQVCTWLQTDNHASTPPLSFFTGRMPFLPPNQQRQRTEGIHLQC